MSEEVRYPLAAGELCSALFDTHQGTGVCEQFGPHNHHGGVVTVGLFRCRRCRRPLSGGRDLCACRCAPVAAVPGEGR